MIGHANEDSGLYYLTQNISSSPSCQAVIGSSPLSRQQQIMFLHSRFGHPSFEYLGIYFLLCFVRMILFSMKFVNLQNINVFIIQLIFIGHLSLLLSFTVIFGGHLV